VFLAEQREPVHRNVALKVVKLGMDTQQVMQRFEAERQALALMDHPNIAKVFDAGSTPIGRPYFVMELVDGIAINEYCDRKRLNIAQRLALFVQVCQAVHHAHQKGLIHRDIKPGNVLVSTVDNRAVAKVIDFGIAKATGVQARDKTVFTQSNQLVGTIEYMSPEQAEGSLDIDTRTDVYSLGVVLYELLTSRTPFEGRDLRSKAYGEMQRIIREIEPPKPSTRLSTLSSLPEVAAHRGIDARQLNAAIRGELDLIVMKCIEKDRARRYESASSLAADIFHHLADEPISAAAPSRVYRARKFVRRRRGPVVASIAVLVALIAGIIGTTWGLIGERHARKQALAAAQTAESRDAESRAVLDFVQTKILAAARPTGQEGGLGHDVTLRKAVEAALPAVEKSFQNQPLVEAQLRRTMGFSFWYLGDSKTAAAQFEVALALSTRLLGADHRETLATAANLAMMYSDTGREAEALKLRQETLAIQKVKLGPDHPDVLAGMQNLANSYNNLGREAEALALREAALPLMRAKLGADHRLTMIGMNNLALSYEAVGRNADALKLREETLALMRAKLGAEHPSMVPIINGLANSYAEVGRQEDALKLREQALALAKAKLGPDHPLTLWCINNLSVSYSHFDRDAEAVALREEVLARRTDVLGADHPDTLDACHNLAYSYAALGRHADALRLREGILLKRKSSLGPDHPDTLRSMKSLAETYHALGRHTEALAMREETLAIRTAKLGPDHPDTLKSMLDVAMSLVELKRAAEAAVTLDDCIERASHASVDSRFTNQLLELRRTLPPATTPASTGPNKP
jgi:tetratricopeptide (TPR) repeat protein